MSEKNYSLKIEKTLKATPEMIFDAWLDQDNISKWLMPAEGIQVPSPKIDPKVGGRFQFDMHAGDQVMPHRGEYKTIDRPNTLQFTWVSEHGTNGLETLVTIKLKAIDGQQTKIELTHELLPTENQRDSHQGGWGRIIDCLNNHCEK